LTLANSVAKSINPVNSIDFLLEASAAMERHGHSTEDAPAPDDELILEDSDDEYVDQFLESQWQDGVEIGLVVSWPTMKHSLQLSTKLPQESITPLFDGTGWAGTRVWKAALMAIEYLEEHYLLDASSQRPRSLLELGCGLGVPSMICHSLQTQQQIEMSSDYKVVVTDQPSLVSQLQANLQTNFPDDDQILARGLSWSREGVLELLQQLKDKEGGISSSLASSPYYPFDICLNCDCIYEPLYGKDSWMALADVLQTIAEHSPHTIMITSVERRNADGLESFFDRLHSCGFLDGSCTECVLRNDDDKHHIVEIYVTKSKWQKGEQEV
jgi:hypothetical protein